LAFQGSVCGLWPSGETGTGLIPAGHSGYTLQPAVSPSSKLETSDGVELSKEVVMKTGNQIQRTIRLTAELNLKVGVVVAAVVGCLLAVPLTRAYKHI
jgi:hypothetical protein